MNAKFGLVVSIVLLAMGLSSAVTTPAVTYELSIYTATPLLFWIGIAAAFAAGIWYTLQSRGRWRCTGLALGSSATLLIALLPILRGYHYYGYRDGLTQLGTVMSILAGDPWNERVIYPLVHTLAATVTLITELPERVVMVGLITIFAGIYIGGSLLLARELADSSQTVSLAIIASWLLLPLMTVRLPTLSPIPMTMASFLVPFVFGIIIRSGRRITPRWAIIVVLSMMMALFTHPILATFLVVVTAIMWALSSGLRATSWRRAAAPLNIQTIPFLIGLISAGWLLAFPHRLNRYAISLVGAVSVTAGGDVSAAGSSLNRIGISLVELGIRLGGVKLVFIALTGVLASRLLWQYWRAGLSVSEHYQVTVALSLLPVGIVVLVFLGAGISNMWSRYLGMSMGVIAILGAIELSRIEQWASVRHVGQTHIALFFVVVLLVGGSVAIIHPSPIVVRPNQHVTDAQMSAYNHGFEHEADDISAVYTIPRNYRDAYYGSVAAARGLGTEQNWRVSGGSHPPDHYAEWINDEPRGEQPLLVSDMARRVHLELFNGEVQNRKDFEAIEAHYHKTYTNGANMIYF